MKRRGLAVLLLACGAWVFAQERGRLIYRLGEKYEVYAYENKTALYEMRKYTYCVDGGEAGYDVVYICGGEFAARGRLAEFLEELAGVGAVEKRVFNVMGMELYTAGNGAYEGEALFMNYQEKKVWRVSLSNTLAARKQEIGIFRRQYEYF
jgi:hypothetical protein